MAYAQDGDLSRYTAVEIADGAMWDGDPEQFIDAVVDARFVDRFSDGEGIAVHDWDKYGGKLLAKRKSDADRKSESRSKVSDGCPTDVRVTAQVEQSRAEENRKEQSRGDAPPRPAPPAILPDDTTAERDCRFKLRQWKAEPAEIDRAFAELKARGKPEKCAVYGYVQKLIIGYRTEPAIPTPPALNGTGPPGPLPKSPSVAKIEANETKRRTIAK